MQPWRKLAHWEMPPTPPCGNCHGDLWERYANGDPDCAVMSFNYAQDCCVPEILETLRRRRVFTSMRFMDASLSHEAWEKVLTAVKESCHPATSMTLRGSNLHYANFVSLLRVTLVLPLERLDLSFTRIGPAGARDIEQYVPYAKHLKHVELDGVEECKTASGDAEK